MLFFFEIMFLILGFCSLGMALYYGKKNGVIKVFHEVKNLEAMDEVQNSTGDEYGYEDEIYGEVTSADLRKAREDESSELSDREKRRKREENKGKEKKPEIKQEKKKRMFNLNDSEAETDLIRKNILAPRISTIVDSSNSNKGNNATEEETAFMKVPGFTTSAASDDEETAFMKSSKPEEICDEEETSFMDSAEEETSFMSAPDEKTPTSKSLIAEENALGSRGERMCGDGSNFADEEETGFMNDSSAFVDNNEEETGFMGACPVSRSSSYSKDSDSDFADEDETGFMSSAMNLSQVSEKKKKNAGNMETGSAEIPVSENIRSFVEEEDEEETGFMRKEEIVRNPAATNRADDEEETSFMGVSLD